MIPPFLHASLVTSFKGNMDWAKTSLRQKFEENGVLMMPRLTNDSRLDPAHY